MCVQLKTSFVRRSRRRNFVKLNERALMQRAIDRIIVSQLFYKLLIH